MSGTYKIIDLNKWKRAMHCEIFRDYVEPAFNITIELDITNFLKVVKAKSLSFTISMVYAVSKSANEIEEFRYRFLDGEVVLYDQIQTSFTYLNPETELFKVICVDIQETLDEYVTLAQKIIREQNTYFTGPLGNDVFQCSALPWISYTHISHTNSGKKEVATPMFSWGKYYEKNHRIMLPFSIQAHHSFVDGLHAGKLADRLQNYLDSL